MLKVTDLPDGITQSDLERIFSDYEILSSEKTTQESGSISYRVELKENENTARKQLDRTEHIIRGKIYHIRVDQFRGGESKRCGQPGEPPCPPPPPPPQ